MAKFKTITLEVLGANIEFPIKVSSKDGLFSTEWPTYIYQVVETSNNFNTYSEIEKEIHKVVKEVNSLNTEVIDIIYYSVDYNIERALREKVSLQLVFVALRKIVCGNSIEFKVIVKSPCKDGKDKLLPSNFTVLGNQFRFYNTGLTQDSNCIPFSEDAYDFFEKLNQKIKDLAKSLNLFLNTETVNQIVSGTLALPNFLPNNTNEQDHV